MRMETPAKEMDQLIFDELTKKDPKELWKIMTEVPGCHGYREFDKSLQRLRKAGRIKYLKKADGGPGWVRA